MLQSRRSTNEFTAHVADIDNYAKLMSIRQLSSLIRLAKVESRLGSVPFAFAVYKELFSFYPELSVRFLEETKVEFFSLNCEESIIQAVGDFYYKYIE